MLFESHAARAFSYFVHYSFVRLAFLNTSFDGFHGFSSFATPRKSWIWCFLYLRWHSKFRQDFAIHLLIYYIPYEPESEAPHRFRLNVLEMIIIYSYFWRTHVARKHTHTHQMRVKSIERSHPCLSFVGFIEKQKHFIRISSQIKNEQIIQYQNTSTQSMDWITLKAT